MFHAVVFFRNWFVLPNNCPHPPPAKKITQLAARMCSFLGRRLVCWRQWHTEGLFADTLADVCFHCRLFIGRCGMNWVLLNWSKKNKPAPSDHPERGTDLRADKSRVDKEDNQKAAYAVSCVAWSQSGTSWQYSSWRHSSGAGPSPSNWRHRERHHQRAQIENDP